MATRRFGPTFGAGTAIVEQAGQQPIAPGAKGWAAYGGVLERGPVGKLIIALDSASYNRQCGSLDFAGGELPLAAKHFYNLANGAGGLLLVRVTDGNEATAEIPIYTRQLPRTRLGTLKADNPGAWGGKSQLLTANTPTDVATDIAETTIDTGLSLKTDELTGGYVELAGVPNASYKITGNDNTGVVTVEADSTMLADLLDGSDPTNNRFYLLLENGGKELTVEIGDGVDDPVNQFRLSVYLDDDLVKDWQNLSTDPSSAAYWVDIINDDSSNYYVEAVDLFTGAHVPSARPANVWSTFTSLTATVLTAVIHEFAINSVSDGDPTFTLGTTTDDHIAQTITLTMTSPTAYTAVSDKFGVLGTAGSGTLGSLYTPNNKWTPSFTVTAGGTALTTSDTLVFAYKPFVPDELIGGRLYPDPDVDRRLYYRIVDNDHKTITVAAGSTMSTDVTVTSGVAATGSITEVAQANHVDGETFVLNDGVHPAITFYYDVTGTYTPGGGYDQYNVRLNIFGASSSNDVATIVATAVNTANGPTFAISAGTVVGALVPLANIASNGALGNIAIIETVADVGFAVTGMSSGITGTSDVFRVQAPLPMSGGRDGIADLTDADYTLQLWDVSSSPFNNTVDRNLGLVKFANPGVTSTVVQKAGIAYASSKNHQYRVEVPVNVIDEVGFDEYVNDTIGRSDYAVVSVPSRGYIANPDGSARLKEITLTGMIHGREARISVDYDGYHKAQAGEEAVLPDLLELPTGDVALNEEFLNPKGINVIKKKQGNYVLWGDRTLWVNAEWKWKHQREQMSYYEHVLQESFDFIIFAINDAEADSQVRTALQSFFVPEYTKRAIRGDTFEDAAQIKVDSENNTNATRADGDLFADVSLRLADTVERFIIRISKQGIFESVG